MNDQEVLFVLGPGVLLLAIACELAWRNGLVPQWVARKVLHAGAVGACALAPLLLDDLVLLRWIVIISEVALIILVSSGHLINNKDGSRSWGIMLFPLPYLLLLFIELERWLIALPMLLLAFSDAMAAVVGNLFGGREYAFTGDPKSIPGSLAFLVCSLVLIALFPSYQALVAGLDVIQAWSLLIAIALMLTAVEALGSKGTDNFFIPLAAWLLLSELDAMPVVFRGPLAIEMGGAIVASMLFIPFMAHMNWLDTGGAVTAALIGSWVLYFAGIEWLLPLFLFLATSTLIGRISRKHKSRSGDRKQGRARDAVQVICNGAVFAVAAAVFDHPMASIAMAVSIAISVADTWASEIGTALRGSTRDILTWRKVPAGLSGGVSLAGTVGGLLGAFIFGIIGSQLIGIMEYRWEIVALITIGGMIGMLLDSVLGASLQPRYRHGDGTLSDQRIEGSTKFSGWNWMDNDLVNLLSNAIITLLIILVIEILSSGRHALSGYF